MSSYTSDGVLNDFGEQLAPGLLGNYIGPNWSNGKYQESVEWGDKDPTDELDLLAYYHDSAYAHYKDELHRSAADRAFAAGARALDTHAGRVAAEAVEKGNMAINGAKRLAENTLAGYARFGPPGAVAGLAYTALQNISKASQRLPGGALDDAYKEVLDYYKTDPHKRQNMFSKLSSTAKSAVSEATLADKELARVAEEKPKYDALLVSMKEKNAAAAKRLQDLAAGRASNSKLRSNMIEPIAEVVNESKDLDGGLWKPVSHRIRQEPTGTQIAGVEPGSVPYFSGLANMFKKKKKKKKNVVHVLPADLANKQAERLKNYSKLRKDAEESLKRPIQGTNRFWFYGPGQKKIDKQLSDLRRKC
nr:MAG: hypothetical protein 2 [Luteoviridae sp.]